MENKILLLLERLSIFLNENEKAITKSAINKVMQCGVSEEKAYQLLLASFLGLEDRSYEEYFINMVKQLDENDYLNDPYYKNIPLVNIKNKNWEIKKVKYQPYELFVYDDFKAYKESFLPQCGYFNKPFYYLACYQNKRLWMSITPNEINTMAKPLLKAKGKVITFGLGLGYFAYMAANLDRVTSVTIIEKDLEVIALFKKFIYPYFEHKEKINIIVSDAFDYLELKEMEQYDYAFIDIYHDVGDGKDIYLKIKNYEKKYRNIHFDYWIYDTIKYYL